jgi:hypothetical protein
MMQTTLRIDDELYREAKAEAAREGVTLTRFLNEALQLRLDKAKAVPARGAFSFRTYRGGQSVPFDAQRLKEVSDQEQERHDIEKLKQSGL